VTVSKVATLVLGIIAVLLGIAFQTQSVAYMVSRAFAVACSSTFPVLLLSLYWRGLTTAGAVAGGTAGLVTAVVLTATGLRRMLSRLGHGPQPARCAGSRQF
jgi:cation/acetate symporter